MGQISPENQDELYLEDNPTEEEIKEQIEVIEKVNEALEEADKSVMKINYTWTILHKWFSENDIKQKYVQYAYKLWWMDFVKLLECENWNWDINAVWDSGKAFWLCQMNTNYHKLPEDYKTNWVVQIEYCYKKYSQGTKFYGPNRVIRWVKCSSYVNDRFILK